MSINSAAQRTHELKCWPVYFEPLMLGRKTFEIRKDDRWFMEGDILSIREWEPGEGRYTGRALLLRVTYILRDFEGLRAGYLVMGIERI